MTHQNGFIASALWRAQKQQQNGGFNTQPGFQGNSPSWTAQLQPMMAQNFAGSPANFSPPMPSWMMGHPSPQVQVQQQQPQLQQQTTQQNRASNSFMVRDRDVCDLRIGVADLPKVTTDPSVITHTMAFNTLKNAYIASSDIVVPIFARAHIGRDESQIRIAQISRYLDLAGDPPDWGVFLNKVGKAHSEMRGKLNNFDDQALIEAWDIANNAQKDTVKSDGGALQKMQEKMHQMQREMEAMKSAKSPGDSSDVASPDDGVDSSKKTLFRDLSTDSLKERLFSRPASSQEGSASAMFVDLTPEKKPSDVEPGSGNPAAKKIGRKK